MALPAPPLDRRDLEAIVQEAQALVPFYTPEWAVKDDVGAGAALLTIFAKMLEGLIRRLNEVPQKNFIAFLNMLGARLLPAQPARVPLTFTLSTGAQEAVRIPARSQAAAMPPEGGDPIVFETAQDIVATPAQLQAIVSVVPARDAIFDHTADVLGDITTELFAGQNLQEHSLYFAQSDLFDLKAEATVTLQFVIQDAGLTASDFTNLVSWEWWNADHWVPSTVPAFHEARDVFLAVTQLDTALSVTEVDAISVQRDVANDTRFPDHGFLLIDNEILAYGRKEGNTFVEVTRGYGQNRNIPGASGMVAHTAGTEVRAIDHPLLVSVDVASISSLAGRTRVTVTLQKTFPAELSAREVAGIDSRWLRCRTLRSPMLSASPLRLLTIDTVRVGTTTGQGILPDALFANDVPLDCSTPPFALYPFGRRPRTTDTFYIASDDALSKRGTPITLDFGVTLGGTASIPVRQVQGIGPAFERLLRAQSIETVEALLNMGVERLAEILGTHQSRAQNILEAAQRDFLDSPAGVPGSVTATPTGEPVLSWEYWDGKGWRVITQREDTTEQLRQTGTVRFPCPTDIAITSVQGQEHYWLRVRIVSGDYGQERFTLREVRDPNDGDTPRTVAVVDTGQIRPPILRRLDIRYGADSEHQGDVGLQTLDYCLAANNLTFSDHTQEAQNAASLFQAFQPPEQAEQALYLGFHLSPVNGPISLFFALEIQEYTEDSRPRLTWEYLRQPAGTAPSAWTRLAVVDGTRRLTESGTIAFIGPPDFAHDVRFGRTLYWLRATNLAPLFQPQQPSTAAAPEQPVTTVTSAVSGMQVQPCPELLTVFHPSFAHQHSDTPPAPRVQGLYRNTVWAAQAETVQDEILGSSSGVANQAFVLAKFPVITEQLWVNELATLSEGERTALAERSDVEVDDVKDDQGTTIAFWIRWRSIDDLTEAEATDRVYSIDRTFGQVQFGDGIHGMIPSPGRNTIKVTYQAGGGVQGNVAAGLITALRTALPFVESVVNRLPGGGGSDTETLARALERSPQTIKNRGRAVTVEDFEWLAREASQAIARVKVLPTFNDQGTFETGWVTVIIVPESQAPRPFPSPPLRAGVEQYLRDRAANLVAFPRHVQVTGPTYVAVNVEAALVLTQIEQAPEVEATALQRLRQFLHPLTGGYLNKGWEFGRLPCLSDFYTLLEDIDGVDHVDNLMMTLRAVTPTGATIGEPQQVTEEQPLTVTMPEHTLIYGETHTITVKA